MDQNKAIALKELHDLHAAVLWRYAVSLTGSASDADDVVQETLFRAWNNEQIMSEEPSEARGWLFTVARNLVIDRARSARQRHERTEAASREPLIDDHSEQVFDRMMLQDALDSLNEHHRQAIVEAYFVGKTTAQVAHELDVAEGTVKSRLHYGLRALRIAFQERGITR